MIDDKLVKRCRQAPNEADKTDAVNVEQTFFKWVLTDGSLKLKKKNVKFNTENIIKYLQTIIKRIHKMVNVFHDCIL